MAENLAIEIQVDIAESNAKLDEFGMKLQKVTTDVKTMQDSLIGDPAKDKTFGTEARNRVETFGKKVEETETKVKKFRQVRERKVKDNLLGKEAVDNLNEVSGAIDQVTQSAEDFQEIVSEAEAGQAVFGKDITEEIDEMNTAVEKLGKTTEKAVDALKDEGFAFDAEGFAPVEKVTGEIEALEKLIDETKDKLATAVDNQAFGADLKNEIGELEDTLEKAETAIADAKKKLADPVPNSPFPVKVTEQMKDLGGIVGDLLPRDIQKLTKGFKMAQKGTASFSKGLKGMSKALASTGIGLLVVALGELVANWDKVTEFALGASDATKEQADAAKSAREAAEEQLNAISDQENILRLNGATEEDILAMKEAQTTEIINATRLQLEALKAQRDEQIANINWWRSGVNSVIGFGVDMVTGFFKFMTTQFEAFIVLGQKLGLIDEGVSLWDKIDEAGEKVKELASIDMATDLGEDDELEEEIKRTEELLTKYENQRAGQQLRRRDEAEKERQSRLAEQQKLLEDQQKFLDDLLLKEKEYGKSQDELAVMRLKRQQESQMEEARQLELSQDELQRLAEYHAQEMADLVQSQEDRKREVAENERQKVLDSMKSDQQLKIESVNSEYDELIALAEKYGMDTTELEAKRQAELRAIENAGMDERIAGQKELRRELELLAMSESEADFARKRDDAFRDMQQRLETAQGNLELEKMIRAQYQAEMDAISNEEKDSYLASREEMFNATMQFANKVNQAYSSIQDIVKANMDAEMIAAKERGASEAELERLQKQHEKRERQFAITNILIQQGQAVASAIAGASAAAATTGPAAPFVLPGYIITATAAIATAFAQVKQIMNKAKASNLPSASSSSGGGGGGRGTTEALTPNLVGDLANENIGQRSEGEASFKTYVVASDVEGENADYGNIVQNATL